MYTLRRGLYVPQGAALSGSAATPNPIYWLHFRSTAGGSGGAWNDGPNATYCLTTDLYNAGTPTRNGWEFGSAATSNGSDNNILSPHFSGNITFTSNSHRINLLLPDGLGTYRIWWALGHPTASVTIGGALKEGGVGGTSFVNVAATALTTGQYMDTNGTIHANASAWIANAAYVERNFTTSALLGLSRNAANTRLDHACIAWQKQ